MPATFEAEQRKADWATAREGEVGEVVDRLIADARGLGEVGRAAVECRYRICRVELHGAERGLAAVIDAMGGERGFQRRALDLHAARVAGGFAVYLRFGR